MRRCEMCGRTANGFHEGDVFNTEYAMWVCEGADAYLNGQYDEIDTQIGALK